MPIPDYEWQSDYFKQYMGATTLRDLKEGKLPEALRVQLQTQLEAKLEGELEGKLEGKLDSVLAVLAARGFEVGDELRARVLAESDLEVVDQWIRRAAVASTLADVFA